MILQNNYQNKNIKKLSNEFYNNLRWIDTHAHYDSKKFHWKNFEEESEFLENIHKSTKHIIQIGTNTNSNLMTLRLVSLYDFVYGMIGFFPTDTWELEPSLCVDAEDNFLAFTKQLLNQKIVGIGEIGLDYHWDSVGQKDFKVIGEQARAIQKKWFQKQLDLAKELNYPVSMHSRDAEEDTLQIFDKYDTIKGVMHCFSYGVESARQYLNKGLYLGIGGTSTYPRNKTLREVIAMCPLERILLETDAPYLSPQLVRNLRNDSSYIKYVIQNIAEIKKVSFEEVVKVTNQNAMNLFKFERS